jgi:hypothetical protein
VDEALPVARERRYVTTNITDLCEVPDDTTWRLHDEARRAFFDLARSNRELKVLDNSGMPSGNQAGTPDDNYTPGEFSGLSEPEPDFEEAGRAIDAVFALNPKWEALLERAKQLKSEKAERDLPS